MTKPLDFAAFRDVMTGHESAREAGRATWRAQVTLRTDRGGHVVGTAAGAESQAAALLQALADADAKRAAAPR